MPRFSNKKGTYRPRGKTWKKRSPSVARRAKRKTGAKAQSRQIATLARQIDKVRRSSSVEFKTRWYRQMARISPLTTAGFAFVMPLPYAPQGVFEDPVTHFHDNLNLQSYHKSVVEGQPPAITQLCGKWFHKGGTLRYRLTSTEPTSSVVKLCLIRAKAATADQVISDRNMFSGVGATPGAQELTKSVDFYADDDGAGLAGASGTWYGAYFNTKIWDVLWSRDCNFGVPGGSEIENMVTGSVLDAGNNALIKTGVIKLPAGGQCVDVDTIDLAPQIVGQDLDQRPNAGTMLMTDQRPEKSVFLVALHNDISLDTETISLACSVTDRYTAVMSNY